MNNLNDGGIHKVLFSQGKLYLDGVQIGGEPLDPAKQISFEFKTNSSPGIPEEKPLKDPSLLEINVFDKVAGKSVGPGQI
jgi:hypothetical protein